MEKSKINKKQKPNGPAAAAILAATTALLVLGLTHLGTEASKSFKDLVLAVGKAWIPNAQGIGPYSGKETFMLVGWILSWIILHLSQRKRTVNLTKVIIIFIIGAAVATLLVYTPFDHFLLGR